jgi:2-hydroxy-4-carboxymuconate semialdehyde hemiacetal dehydrogenase
MENRSHHQKKPGEEITAMKVCMVGEGAFANKHLDAIARIDEVEVTRIVGGVAAETAALARTRRIARWGTSLEEALLDPEIEAVILTTPTQLHARQAIQTMQAGKHVLVEIPMADSLADAKEIVRVQKETGRIAMIDHVRRFNPSHQWIHEKIKVGELKIQQMDVQTYFFRRQNINALGQPRSWTDHLLWHHACHTVDLFQYQTGESASQAYALAGPKHPELGISLDMSIGLKVPSGAICTLSLSFNNQGPLGTYFRYICDNGTFLARYDDLYDAQENPVDVSAVAVSKDGVELCDREFFAAIREGREPNSSAEQCLSAMITLDQLEKKLTEH